MAVAYKCDICGTFYEWTGAQNHLTIERKYGNGSRDTQESLDICPNCVKALHDFMKERSNHETAKETD